MNARQKKKQFKKKYGKWSKYTLLKDCYIMQNALDNLGKAILRVTQSLVN